MQEHSSIFKLQQILKILRDKQTGCPWHQQQNFQSIAAYTVEEANEVQAAIEQQDLRLLCEELGDLLFQVLYHSQLAEEIGCFSFQDVLNTLQQKITRRHPHIFGTAEEKLRGYHPEDWQRIKSQEKNNNAKTNHGAVPYDMKK